MTIVITEDQLGRIKQGKREDTLRTLVLKLSIISKKSSLLRDLSTRFDVEEEVWSISIVEVVSSYVLKGVAFQKDRPTISSSSIAESSVHKA